MKKTCQVFLLLSIFLTTAVYIRANRIDKQTHDSWTGSRNQDDRVYDLREEEEEDGNIRGTTPPIVDASRRSLASWRVAFLTSPTITPRIVHQRRKRDAASDDDDAAAAAARFVSYGASRENEDSLREKRILHPWRFNGHVTKKRGKHRRRCKKHHGCSRSDRRNKNKNNNKKRNRNVNKKWKMLKPLEHHKWFEQQSHSNRNIETRVLVGNRPLATFRKELAAAAAAANAAEAIATTRKLVDQFLDIKTKDIDDTIIPDKKLGRTRTTTKLLSSRTSTKNKNFNVKRKNGKKKRKNSIRTRDKHAEREREKYEALLKSGIFDDTKKFETLDDSSPIEYHPWKISKNFTNMYDTEKKELKNKTSSDILAKVANGESKTTSNIEDRDFVDKSIIASVYMPNDDRVIIHESLVTMLSKLIDSRDNSTTLRNNSEITESANERGNLSSPNGDENDINACQKWIDSEKKLEDIFLGPLVYLPACPCQYPSGIINADGIWDKYQKKYFRWQDVSNKTDGDDVIHKPAHKYCIKSSETGESPHTAVQHCCYDNQKRLLTQGSEAATPIFLSSEISSELHEIIDNLPWKPCTSDLTRFHKVRIPNNDNRCTTNPEDKDYQR